MNRFYAFILFLVLASCQTKTLDSLKTNITQEFSKVDGSFAVAFKDLQNGNTLFINEDSVFHAASTMKLPVMIEVFKQVKESKFTLSDSIEIKNEFKSIVDSSLFSLDVKDDSDTLIYNHIGEKKTIYSLMYDMIIVSSNMATNIVIDKVGASNVQQTIRTMGTKNMKVLRGVEDKKAYRSGLSNTTTAYDLMVLLEKIAMSNAVDSASSNEMMMVLLDQKFNDIIPAHLPDDVKVAHKTGWIAGLHHDAAIVFLPDGRKYVLVLLSKKLKDEKVGVEIMGKVSKLIYEWVR